jgi:hypothetical protein
MGKREEVLQALEDLLKMDDVLACMLAKKGLEGIVPPNLKIRDINLWQLINKTTEQIFSIIERFYVYRVERFYFELGENTIIIAPVSQEFSLIVIIPSLANMGLLDVEIENTRRKIKTIIDKRGSE